MAISHARAAQPIDVHPLGARLPGAKTIALFKSEEQEVIRLVLLAGKSFPPHRVLGAITIQCLEGQIEVSIDDSSQQLGAGQMLFLPGNALHGVTALADASALVTIVLHR